MCDLEGDIETVGLLVNDVVTISPTGQVGPDRGHELPENYFEVKGVYSCVGCSVADILPLLGHDRSVTSNYVVNENYIPYKEDQIKQFNELSPRAPGVCLVKEGDKLVGVLIDSKNKARVLGSVSRVMPTTETLRKKNVLLLDADGKEHVSESASIELDCLAESSNATVGIVSLNGFLLLQSTLDRAQLTLILSGGYLVLQKRQVFWTRRCVDQLATGKTDACKQSLVGEKEIFVVNMGVIMSADEAGDCSRMNLIGTHNAIINYQAFKRCIACYDIAQGSQLPTK